MQSIMQLKVHKNSVTSPMLHRFRVLQADPSHSTYTVLEQDCSPAATQRQAIVRGTETFGQREETFKNINTQSRCEEKQLLLDSSHLGSATRAELVWSVHRLMDRRDMACVFPMIHRVMAPQQLVTNKSTASTCCTRLYISLLKRFESHTFVVLMLNSDCFAGMCSECRHSEEAVMSQAACDFTWFCMTLCNFLWLYVA